MNLKYIYSLFYLFYLLNFYSQKADFGFNKIEFSYNNDFKKIEFNYEIFSKNKNTTFKIDVKAFRSGGSEINMKSIGGDSFEYLHSGNHDFMWDPLADNYILDEEIYFEFKLSKTGKEKVPMMTHLFESILFPGAGNYRIRNGKHYFLSGLLGYGALIGFFRYDRLSVDSYQNYLDATSSSLGDKYFNAAVEQNSISRILAVSAATIWTLDLSRVIIRSLRVNNKIADSQFSRYYYKKSKLEVVQRSKSKHINNKEDYMIAYEKSGSLPPILKINDILFSENVLDGNEQAYLTVNIQNVGPGASNNTFLKLNSDVDGIEFKKITKLPTIAAVNGKRSIKVPIKGAINLKSSLATLNISLYNSEFKINIKAKPLTFRTREFRKPKLTLVKYNATESQSATKNNKIDVNEMIDFVFYVQNIGSGDASNVSVEVNTNQKGIILLGKGSNNNYDKLKEDIVFREIEAGKFKLVNYKYFINSDFKDQEIKFYIKVIEKFKRFGFEEVKSFTINSQLAEHGSIRKVKIDDDYQSSNIVIEDTPDLVVDVDINIPVNNKKNPHRYALIIGNEDYSSFQTDLSSEVNVDYAINDAKVFSEYCDIWP